MGLLLFVTVVDPEKGVNPTWWEPTYYLANILSKTLWAVTVKTIVSSRSRIHHRGFQPRGGGGVRYNFTKLILKLHEIKRAGGLKFLLCRFATECDFYRYWLTSFAILISSSGQELLSPLSIFCQKYTKIKEIGRKREKWCTSFTCND